MDSHDSHRIAVQLKRIADALERAYPPPPKPKKESAVGGANPAIAGDSTVQLGQSPHFSERRGVVY